MTFNRFQVAGYLAAKPELRYTGNGTPVANARLGETHRYLDAEGTPRERTNWHALVFYGKLAQLATAYDKGDNLFVHDGTIQQRKFTPKDGSERTVHEVIVFGCHVIAPLQFPQQQPEQPETEHHIQAHDLEDWPA